MATLRWGIATDPGRIRQQNEDSVLVDENIFVVADGMGGHKAGEVASALTVEMLKSRLGDDAGSLDDVLAAVVEANTEIFKAATANVDRQGMGTTLTGLFVIKAPVADDAVHDGSKQDASTSNDAQGDEPDTEPGQAFALVNVGDSRTYLLRHGRLRRVTMDHNYVQELVNTGHITDDEARTTPAATSSPAPSASIRPCASTHGRCPSCVATASWCAPTVCPTKSTTTKSIRSSPRSATRSQRPTSWLRPPTAMAAGTTSLP